MFIAELAAHGYREVNIKVNVKNAGHQTCNQRVRLWHKHYFSVFFLQNHVKSAIFCCHHDYIHILSSYYADAYMDLTKLVNWWVKRTVFVRRLLFNSRRQTLPIDFCIEFHFCSCISHTRTNIWRGCRSWIHCDEFQCFLWIVQITNVYSCTPHISVRQD